MTNTGNKKIDEILFELGQQTKATLLVQIREDDQIEYWLAGSVLRGEGAPDNQRYPFLSNWANGLQKNWDEYRGYNPPLEGEKED